jgi:heavy metal translocating P-type ATPase
LKDQPPINTVSKVKTRLQNHWRHLLFLVCASLALTSWISGLLSPLPSYAIDALALAAALVGGIPIIIVGVNALLHRDLDVDFLASIAIVAALVIGQFLAAALVALMLSGGAILEDYTARRTSRAIEKLIESTPKTARVRRNGDTIEVPIEEVREEETVLVKPGEKIPVDGIVITGRASVNQAPITGESIAVEKPRGSQVLTGTIVELGALEIRVTKVGEDTTFARIIKLIREGQENRAPVEKIADRYARYFGPAILLIAVVVFAFTRNVVVAVSTLVIACPCALTLATPTAVVSSIGNAAKKGILIRGGAALEIIGNVNAVVLDKTGTLTLGTPKVMDVKSFGGATESEVVRLAAVAEKFSEHPLSKAIVEKAHELGVSVADPTDFEVTVGHGVKSHLNGAEILVGNDKLLKSLGIKLTGQTEHFLEEQEFHGRTVVFVCENRSIIGIIGIADVSREGVAEAIGNLRNAGIKRVVMLTGDKRATADSIAEQAGITEVESDLLPEQKVEYVKRLKEEGYKVLMVGDGINDAPSLATAHVGVAMGKIGSDVAIETADVVLMSDDLAKVSKMISLGKKTLSMIKQNIFLAMMVNILGIIFAVHGDINPILAAAIHEGNALFVVLNSARLLWVK